MRDGPTGSGNVARWGGGIADVYDRVRPTPPRAIVDLLTQLAGGARPSLVVDLGSGTGISARLWTGAADHVVGIEPSTEMRRKATEGTPSGATVGRSLDASVSRSLPGTIEYRDASSTATGLADACADVVTASQSLHWMEPGPTFAEVARILRPGGVFAAFDCDWPPAVQWEAERAYAACMELAFDRETTLGLRTDVQQWEKSEHLTRMASSGHFRHFSEVTLHLAETGDAERFVGLALSQSRVHCPLAHGATEDEIGLTTLRDVARRTLGDTQHTFWFSYRVRIGVK